jgi:nucleotide-binding universal stress UspA family protein
VTVIAVTEPLPVDHGSGHASGWIPSQEEVDRFDAACRERASKALDEARAMAEQIGVSAELLHVPNAHPATAIIETAKSRGCGLIVMASHGRRGLRKLFLGSQTSEVLADGSVPVLHLVVRLSGDGYAANRCWSDPRLVRASVDYQHGGLHGVGAKPVQRFLAGLSPALSDVHSPAFNWYSFPQSRRAGPPQVALRQVVDADVRIYVQKVRAVHTTASDGGMRAAIRLPGMRRACPPVSS